MAESAAIVKLRLLGAQQFASEAKGAAGGLGRLEHQSEKTSRGIGGIGRASGVASKGFKSVIGPALAFGTALASIATVKDAISTTTSLAKTTTQLGASFGFTDKQATAYAATAKVRGIDDKKLILSFTTLAKASRGAVGGSKAQALAFRQLGVSQQTLKLGDTAKLLSGVADGLSKIENPQKRLVLGTKLFGKSYQALRPLLQGGSKDLQAQLDLANKYVPNLGQTAKKVRELAAMQREQKLATLGLKTAIGSALIPVQLAATKAVFKLINGFRDGKGVGGALHKVISALAANFKENVVPILKLAAAGVSALVSGFKNGTGAGGVIAKVVTFIGSAVKTADGAIRGFVVGIKNGTGAGGVFAKVVTTIAGGVVSVGTAIVKWLIQAFPTVAAGFKRVATTVLGFGRALISALKPALPFVKNVIVPAFKLIAGAVMFIVRESFPVLKTVARIVFGSVVAVVRVAIGVIKAIATVLGGAGTAFGGFKSAVKAGGRAVSAVFAAIKSVIGTSVSFILHRLDDILGGFSSVISIGSGIPGIGGQFKQAANGIDAARASLRSTADELDGIKKKSAGGIDIPITVNGLPPTTGIGFIDQALSGNALAAATAPTAAAAAPGRPKRAATKRRPSGPAAPQGARRPRGFRASGASAPALAAAYGQPIVVQVSTMLDGRVLHQGVHRVERHLQEQG